jgi:hypothetical protein
MSDAVLITRETEMDETYAVGALGFYVEKHPLYTLFFPSPIYGKHFTSSSNLHAKYYFVTKEQMKWLGRGGWI